MSETTGVKLLVHIDRECVPYVNLLKPILSGRVTTYIDSTIPTTAYEYAHKAKQKGCCGVATTDLALLQLLLPDTPNLRISTYAGSIIRKYEVDFLILDPLEHLVKVPYGRFVAERFLSKLTDPSSWGTEPEFRWELFEAARVSEYTEFFQLCDLIAVDIETIRDDPDRAIECISFTGCMLGGEEIGIRTVVVPFADLFCVAFVRRICAMGVPKTLQNGKYDIAYLLRYRIPVTNYLLDTVNLFHCWLSELPKDLGFISAMMVRGYSYHKDEGSYGGKFSRFSYNAKDTYYTLLSTLGLLKILPDYARRNYLLEFPIVYPCMLSEHTGIKWDKNRALVLKDRVEKKMDKELEKLRTMVANPFFNPSSSQQTVRLYQLLGSGDIKSSGKIQADKVSFRHPLNRKIISSITDYREKRKLESSYFKDGVEWLGRVFYALNPHATDTSRLASRESQFWCGLQIQNIPRDEEGEETAVENVKDAFVSDPGFYFFEADYSQNEARGTAYLSGDTALIKAVEDVTKDFHGHNASQFFGVPYESIVKSTCENLEWIHKVINKALRDLSKRTNHGANYNMGPGVLLDTMGIERVIKARKLLGLPSNWSLLKVTTYLLEVFDKTYPILRKDWYDKVISDVVGSGYLVGPTGWTRKCFGKPQVNKRDLNRYVAHPPQSLGAQLLNKSYLRVFQEIYLSNPNDFKLNAQIHDSILGQYRIGREDLAWKVKECMDNPVEVTDTFGIKRILRVPVDLKGGGRRWSELTTLKTSSYSVA